MPATDKTRRILDLAFRDYHLSFRRDHDPVGIAHRYPDRQDQEVVAFFCALLAYGNVRAMRQALEKFLTPLGPRPHQTVLHQPAPAEWSSFIYRFNREPELAAIHHRLQCILRAHGSIEGFFLKCRPGSAHETHEAISSFIESFHALPLPEALEKRLLSREGKLNYLLPNPKDGSACKRLNLFLRWMVRHADGIDLGLWEHALKPKELLLPVDTHLLKTLRALRWTRSKTASWLVVENATDRLRKFDPEDPIKYDFALCHLSMEGRSLLEFQNASVAG